MTMLKKVLMLVLVSSVLLASTQAWKDMHDRLKNRVIHFETTAQRGHWLMNNGRKDSAGSFLLWVDPFTERDTYTTPKVQFVTSVCGGGKYLCLESLSAEYHYLAAGGNKDLKLERVDSDPQLKDVDFHFKVLCQDDTLNKCKVVPIRFESESYLMVTANGIDKGHYNGVLDKDTVLPRFWRIHAPNPTNEYVQVFQSVNTGNSAQNAQYSTSVGVTDERSSTNTITQSTSLELGLAFESFSGAASSSIENVWENSVASSFQTSKTVVHTLIMPPKSKITLLQLVGHYGEKFKVGIEAYKIKEEKAGPSKRYYIGPLKEYLISLRKQGGF